MKPKEIFVFIGIVLGVVFGFGLLMRWTADPQEAIKYLAIASIGIGTVGFLFQRIRDEIDFWNNL